MKYGYSLLALTALLAAVIAGCGGGGGGGGGGGDGPVNVSITIQPTQVTGMVPGNTQTFTATVTGTTNTAVVWSIQEGSAGGIIIPSGDNTAVYTAPSAWNKFHVVVTSVADPTKSATAEVQIGPPGPPD